MGNDDFKDAVEFFDQGLDIEADASITPKAVKEAVEYGVSNADNPTEEKYAKMLGTVVEKLVGSGVGAEKQEPAAEPSGGKATDAEDTAAEAATMNLTEDEDVPADSDKEREAIHTKIQAAATAAVVAARGKHEGLSGDALENAQQKVAGAAAKKALDEFVAKKEKEPGAEKEAGAPKHKVMLMDKTVSGKKFWAVGIEDASGKVIAQTSYHSKKSEIMSTGQKVLMAVKAGKHPADIQRTHSMYGGPERKPLEGGSGPKKRKKRRKKRGPRLKSEDVVDPHPMLKSSPFLGQGLPAFGGRENGQLER
jgi:hypothetical protein